LFKLGGGKTPLKVYPRLQYASIIQIDPDDAVATYLTFNIPVKTLGLGKFIHILTDLSTYEADLLIGS
jgi:hypothetical protein